jgi:anti-sigma28 factor (negative regulator of flagellin synthesis)
MPAPLPLDRRAARQRARHVARIARLVRSGRYRVPSERVADAIITFHRRGG